MLVQLSRFPFLFAFSDRHDHTYRNTISQATRAKQSFAQLDIHWVWVRRNAYKENKNSREGYLLFVAHIRKSESLSVGGLVRWGRKVGVMVGKGWGWGGESRRAAYRGTTWGLTKTTHTHMARQANRAPVVVVRLKSYQLGGSCNLVAQFHPSPFHSHRGPRVVKEPGNEVARVTDWARVTDRRGLLFYNRLQNCWDTVQNFGISWRNSREARPLQAPLSFSLSVSFFLACWLSSLFFPAACRTDHQSTRPLQAALPLHGVPERPLARASARSVHSEVQLHPGRDATHARSHGGHHGRGGRQSDAGVQNGGTLGRHAHSLLDWQRRPPHRGRVQLAFARRENLPVGGRGAWGEFCSRRDASNQGQDGQRADARDRLVPNPPPRCWLERWRGTGRCRLVGVNCAGHTLPPRGDLAQYRRNRRRLVAAMFHWFIPLYFPSDFHSFILCYSLYLFPYHNRYCCSFSFSHRETLMAIFCFQVIDSSICVLKIEVTARRKNRSTKAWRSAWVTWSCWWTSPTAAGWSHRKWTPTTADWSARLLKGKTSRWRCTISPLTPPNTSTWARSSRMWWRGCSSGWRRSGRARCRRETNPPTRGPVWKRCGRAPGGPGCRSSTPGAPPRPAPPRPAPPRPGAYQDSSVENITADALAVRTFVFEGGFLLFYFLVHGL